MAAAEKPCSKGQAWFCTTGLPSDIVVEVDDMAFHLHKFPLMSKSRKLHQLITEEEANPTGRREEREGDGDGDGDEIEEIECHITLPAGFPGGSETFETAAKFCYGVKIEVNAWNVAPLRCAGEVLEMTEEYSEDNLISKTERFFSQSVLRSLKDSIRALKSCERLMPLAETLGITERCVDSIAARASSADPALFGWPVNDGAKESQSSKQQILWNGIDAGGRRRNLTRGTNAEPWFEDLVLLSLPFFNRVISSMRDRDLSPEIIESCLIYYAKKHIPGISRSNNRKPSTSSSSIAHPRISEEEREKICGVMDCQKLTLEACTHAAQNERLPLRAVVQVLFFEQLQLRHAIAGTLLAAETAPHEPGRPSLMATRRGGDGEEEEEGEVEVEEGARISAQRAEGQSTWRAAVRENQVLRLDMDSMRTRVHQLERECSTMKKVIEKIDKAETPENEGPRKGGSKLSRRFGCKFKTQVCDSHEPTVGDGPRKGRRHHHHQH
ncbi:hypothetical protein FH972_004234 [Carpinus fangiana]|uniref:NPH3 domain-containing protein n=1 Tax=Carpinus fangiana TaxID=176857 RepID=A0A5N6QMY2_9ROSI|nr:hypothetical protein FH972_004234 [Carpinus fangiana]